MSKYTTGEIARLCGVSVRTVQYYDSRGILTPSDFSDGGRRLYSEDDLQRMRIICFLRELDLPLNSIGELLSEEHPEKVISILLNEQESVLCEEIKEKQTRLDKLTELKKALKTVENFSVETIGDIAHIMENKKKMRRLRSILLAMGLPISILELCSILLWIFKDIWWVFFVVYTIIAIPFAIFVSRFYLKRVAYICPECHAVFKPTLKEAFWARHTPNTRRLTCTMCGHKGFCVEIYDENTAK